MKEYFILNYKNHYRGLITKSDLSTRFTLFYYSLIIRNKDIINNWHDLEERELKNTKFKISKEKECFISSIRIIHSGCSYVERKEVLNNYGLFLTECDIIELHNIIIEKSEEWISNNTPVKVRDRKIDYILNQ